MYLPFRLLLSRHAYRSQSDTRIGRGMAAARVKTKKRLITAVTGLIAQTEPLG
jgi:hypothetical protein